MLLVRLEVLIERSGWQADCFGNEGCEEDADLSHPRHVFGIHGLEVWKGGWPRAIVWARGDSDIWVRTEMV